MTALALVRTPERMSEHLDSFIRSLGPWGYPVFLLAALIEYIFPPFPGDTVVVLGGAWAARGDRSLVLLAAMLTVGNIIGIAATWRLGRSLAARINTAKDGELVLGMKIEHIRKAQDLMRARGALLLVTNRFLPSFRAVIFLAAGASEVTLIKSLVLGTISALLFNALLVGVGYEIGDNAEAIAAFFSRFRIASFILLGVIAAIFLGRFLWKRARAHSAA